MFLKGGKMSGGWNVGVLKTFIDPIIAFVAIIGGLFWPAIAFIVTRFYMKKTGSWPKLSNGKEEIILFAVPTVLTMVWIFIFIKFL